MRYFKFTADTPYCGTENEYFYKIEDENATPADLDEMAEELARDNAESFEYLIHGWDYNPVEEGEMTEEEYEQSLEDYYADYSCKYEEISAEEYEEETGDC